MRKAFILMVMAATWLCPHVTVAAGTPLRDAINDLIETYGDRYPQGKAYLERLDAIEASGDDEALAQLRRQALLANPLLDFDRLLVLRRNFDAKRARQVISTSLGLSTLNAHTNDSIRRTGWDNEIAVLSDLRGGGELTTLYQPGGGKILKDLKLHFDADRLMFSTIGKQGNWRVFEMKADGSDVRQVTPDDGADVGHFDSCYLPDGHIIFASNAVYQGLPCEYGKRAMCCLYLLDPKTGDIRQLTFEQDSDWCPAVLNDGRVMYLRWEYSDLPHSNSRIVFSMNPDGTNQAEYYGSNSYFPNSFFFAKPVPGHPTMIAGIVGGHHGISRSGRLLLLDPAKGRQEAEGVVQEIPGRGKEVKPTVRDRLIDGVWPQFLHPYPLSEKYYLVAAKITPQSLWGIYLVDVFDNIVLIKEVEGAALLEPIPLQKSPTPPAITDRVDLTRDDATVYLADVYAGPGLKGIPRGKVKQLRVVEYYFSYRGVGGLLGSIGMDGPWDIKRVLGTVPVEADGSASFVIPANSPVTVQPLDENGAALNLMRSWFVGMPGEQVGCVGCHGMQNQAASHASSQAFGRPPSRIKPWYGPARGFNFQREVQPVLDKYCVGCHDGRADDDGATIADLRHAPLRDWSSQYAGRTAKGGRFSVPYAYLHRFVRRPGIEGDLHALNPMDFHSSTTELVQLLRKGHHGVELDDEAWDRLITWIDLNAPYHGTWSEIDNPKHVQAVAKRARELRRKYVPTGPHVDYEAIPEIARGPIEPVLPKRKTGSGKRAAAPGVEGWPFDAAEAKRRQQVAAARAGEKSATREIDLGEGVTLKLTLVPAGRFVMGAADGHVDEQPQTAARIDKSFWMATCELTNAQFARFDPAHDSRLESRHGYQFGRLGYPLNEPQQPVVRVSWRQAQAFCDWLSEKTDQRFRLPTEGEWEYACRAGTGSPFWFGSGETDFAKFANLGDRRLSEYAADTAHNRYESVRLLQNANEYDDWVPKDDRFDDGGFVSTAVGRYAANVWGLHDMHGNVWEWTQSSYRAYPYAAGDGRNRSDGENMKVVRGGSWYDRPKRCRSSYRLFYQPFHQVYNVGFRVVCDTDKRNAKP